MILSKSLSACIMTNMLIIILNQFLYWEKLSDKSRRRFSLVLHIYLCWPNSAIFCKSTLSNFVICDIRRDANYRSAHERIFVICVTQIFLKLVPRAYIKFLIVLILKSVCSPLSSFTEYYDRVARYILQ